MLALPAALLSAPAAAAPHQLVCTADRVMNDGTGEKLALPAEPFRHTLTAAEAAAESYSRVEHRTEGPADSAIEHRIDLRTNRFQTTTSLTRHDLGESYLISTSGTCQRSGG